jgi:hypothetical protein
MQVKTSPTLTNSYFAERGKMWAKCQQDYQLKNKIGWYDARWYKIYGSCAGGPCPTADQWNKINKFCAGQEKNGAGRFSNSNQGSAPYLGTFTKTCLPKGYYYR